jgi:hypothetical protein
MSCAACACFTPLRDEGAGRASRTLKEQEFDLERDTMGNCHRRAPSITPDQQLNEFPRVSGGSWCWEFIRTRESEETF